MLDNDARHNTASGKKEKDDDDSSEKSSHAPPLASDDSSSGEECCRVINARRKLTCKSKVGLVKCREKNCKRHLCKEHHTENGVCGMMHFPTSEEESSSESDTELRHGYLSTGQAMQKNTKGTIEKGIYPPHAKIDVKEVPLEGGPVPSTDPIQPCGACGTPTYERCIVCGVPHDRCNEDLWCPECVSVWERNDRC